jgi:hypothetical protein
MFESFVGLVGKLHSAAEKAETDEIDRQRRHSAKGVFGGAGIERERVNDQAVRS